MVRVPLPSADVRYRSARACLKTTTEATRVTIEEWGIHPLKFHVRTTVSPICRRKGGPVPVSASVNNPSTQPRRVTSPPGHLCDRGAQPCPPWRATSPDAPKHVCHTPV